MLVFWYCFDDALAAHFGVEALGTVPLWIWAVATLAPIALHAGIQISAPTLARLSLIVWPRR